MSNNAVENQPSWLSAALSGELSRSVIFVDTLGEMLEATNSGGITNPGEADLVKRLTTTLTSNCTEATVGVIAPYRAQVELLKRTLSTLSVDVNTVDQFQGKVSHLESLKNI